MKTQYYDIPYKPNPTQAEVHKNLKHYNVVVLHRGLGKTHLCIQELIKEALCQTHRGADYIYAAPTRVDAERIAWKQFKESLVYYAQDEQGNRIKNEKGQFILKPMEGIKIREDKLTITFLHNNATIYVVGTNDPDSLRGIHPFGVVMDETGMHSRDAWFQTILPAIQRNDGWIIFIGTPKGANLFKELYDIGQKMSDKGWYTMYRNVYQTGLYTTEKIQNLRSIMPVPEFEQEYMCKWDAAFTGAYYSDMLNNNDHGIITDVPWNPMFPVITGWDLGLKDPTCIWFAQQVEGKVHLIDYYESTDKDIFSLLSVVRSKPYRYSYHVVPHDIAVRSPISLETRESVMKKSGFKLLIAPKINLIEGISLVQSKLYLCRMDRAKCHIGIEKLRAYTSKLDKMTGQPTNEPSHKNSDAADALRTLFLGMRKAETTVQDQDDYWWLKPKSEVMSDYDVMAPSDSGLYI